MVTNRKEIGIVGLGNFGSFLAARLAKSFDVIAWDIADKSALAESLGLHWGTLAQVACREIVVLAVPLQSMDSVLKLLADFVGTNTLVMDVCSVKQEPIHLMHRHLPQAELLGTHPLFGPQSAKDGWSGHRIAVCNVTGPSPKTKLMLQFFRDQGLKLITVSAKEHDREMAKVQALTHFIARAVSELGLGDSEFSTTAYSRLMESTGLLGSDSWALFETIQNGNPFAAEMRQRFVVKLKELEKRLKRR